MQWVRAACVRPAPSMRVCARSYLGRASIAKTVVDIFATNSFKKSGCLRVRSCIRVSSVYLTPYSAFRYYLFKASRNLLYRWLG